MITLEALYDYKAKVERELLVAEAKVQVVNDLIAESLPEADTTENGETDIETAEVTEQTTIY